MMLVVSALASLGIGLAQRSAAIDAQRDMERDFSLELASLHRLEELRTTAATARCSALVQNPRIHAALEDNALDLLYPSAREELRDLMDPMEPRDATRIANPLHARFYRFLDGHGAVLSPADGEAGALTPNEQARLALAGVPETVQTGYLVRPAEATVDEMVAMPIRSSETDEVIAALVLGFKPLEDPSREADTGMKRGIFVEGELHLPAIAKSAATRLGGQVAAAIVRAGGTGQSIEVAIGETSHLLFYKCLNLHSNYPPAYEVCVYPLTRLLARQRQLRWEMLGAGGALLLGGFFMSHLFSRRLSRPVEKLVVVSEENRAQRQRAEAALQSTSQELQRSARFSADASHQLKSPIAILRAGLDDLLARDNFSPEVYEEIASLIHQTYRLTGMIEDLLLLSRMDAGRLQLTLHTVNLTELVEEWLDDLRALPDVIDLKIETELPGPLWIAGEKKYTTLVVQNLLDNARKYNRPGGAIRIRGRENNGRVLLSIANTGHPIPAAAQAHIFERFHRGTSIENVPGHGLGLNLARELVHLHSGELRLVRSDDEWTEFSVSFKAAKWQPVLAGAVG